MTYSEKLTALHKGLTPIYLEQDRINFARKLAGDIRVLLPDDSYLTFNTIDSDGLIWVVSDIEGWWTLTEPSIPDIDRGWGDGSFDVSGRNLARTLTLTGSVVIQSGDRNTIATLSASARHQLLNAFDLVRRGTWIIVDEDEYKRAAYVRLSGAPQISTMNSRGRIDFSIGLKAADPIKYEWVETLQTSPDSNQILIGERYNFASITNTIQDAEYRYYTQGTGYNGLGNPSDYSRGSYPAGVWSNESGLIDWRLGEPTGLEQDGYRTYGTIVHAHAGAYDSDTSIYGGNTASLSSALDVFSRGYLGNVSSGGQQAVDTITVINHGDANVYCIFRVVGPLYGPAIIQNITTGQEMTILAATNIDNQVLGPTVSSTRTQYLEIDTRTREVHIGDYEFGTSTDSSRGLLEPLVDWIYLQPGANTIFFNDAGAGSSTSVPILQIYYRSGWIG